MTAIFNDEVLRNKLAFRGGTALHKLYINPSARYSEDIDLVQIHKEPFGEVLTRLRECLSFLGIPKLNQKEHNNTLIFQINTTAGAFIKLKVEVNTREQFSFLGYINVPFSVNSAWHTASTLITTFTIDEILATKLRALYQRKKGRDLFDLWYALEKTTCSPQIIVDTWRKYMEAEQHKISKKQFELNLSEKTASPIFLTDMKTLIKSEIDYDAKIALKLVLTKLIECI